MTTTAFEYRALDRAGAGQRGVTRAATRIDAYRQITASGLTPLSIREAGGAARRGRSGVKSRDVAHFTYQLSALVAARIPVPDGLRAIAEQEPNLRFRAIIGEAASRVEAGERMSDALGSHPGVFGEIYIHTLRAAEHSGSLVTVLEYLAEMLERDAETRQRVRAALMYPACVVGVLVLAVFLLVGFVVPGFTAMFRERGVDLPTFTWALGAVGGSVQTYWWAYLAITGVLAGAARMAWRRPAAREALDRTFHRIPFLRSILMGLAASRFTRVFGLCLHSGIELIEALGLAGRASGSALLRRDVERMVGQVRTGGRLSRVFSDCPSLPPFTRRMLCAGEESGELPRLCAVAARHHDRESAALTANICTVIEPALIVLIAAVVLVVALAIFQPMWNMVKLVG